MQYVEQLTLQPHASDQDDLDASDTGQINVPPTRRGALWKVISSAIRCPVCRSTESKAITGKRRNAQGMTEHYRVCSACEVHFRVVLE